MNFFFKLNTGYLFISTAKKFYKIPLNFNAYRNLLIEKKKIIKVKKNKIFKNFLSDESFFLIKKSNRYYNFDLKKNNFFLKEFENLFKLKVRSKKLKVTKIFFFKNIDLLLKYEPFIYKDIYKFASKIYIHKSSCHGDFYYKNILESDNKKIFIDWNNFQVDASYYYDFINYIIFSKKNYFGNWYKSWSKNYEYLTNRYPKVYVETYVLWKISTEMNSQKLDSRLKNKMINILKDYTNFINRRNK